MTLEQTQLLIQTLGIPAEAVTIYTILLERGFAKASKLVELVDLSRPMVYKMLDILIEQGLVEKYEKAGTVTLFQPTEPKTLEKLINERIWEARNLESSLPVLLSDIQSTYNMTAGKPYMQFFEGEAGIRKVLFDSLTATGEIFTYADVASVEKYFAQANREYVAERNHLQIPKKILLMDSPEARSYIATLDTSTTEVRLVPNTYEPQYAAMQIYNNKISYITLSDAKLIGVIIEDPRIASLHKHLFVALYNSDPTSSNTNTQPSA